MPTKTRQKIAERLAQVEQLDKGEDGMLADTDEDDQDDIVAKSDAQDLGAAAGGGKNHRLTVRAESERDVDALAAEYLSLDAAAQAYFRKKCGVSVV